MVKAKLTNAQVIILKVLLRNPNGLNRDQIIEKAQCVVDNSTLGPVYEETQANHPESLTALRLVLRKKYTPDEPVMYFLSEAGKKAATAYSARKWGAKDKVPADVLNPIVLKIRPFKTYGIENFTEDDIKEIRAKLPEEFQAVTVDSLRRQITNQRKVGAYSQEKYTEPAWYREYRTQPEFKIFAQRVREFSCGCMLCGKTAETEVYHRNFANLYREHPSDGIELCPTCHKRNYKFMPSIPESEPDTFENESE